MRIKSHKAYNWCQHEYVELSPSQGLTGIRGNNGSGKSNLIESMVYGLTGKVRTEGVLKDNIRQGASTRAQSGVEMVVEHGESVLEIRRMLQPASQTLIVRSPTGEEEKFDKAASISAKLQSVFGIDEDMQLKYVFIEQCKIFEFLDLTDEKRAKFLSSLFDVDHAEAVWKAVGDYPIQVPAPSRDVEAARARLANIREEMASLGQVLATLPEGLSEWSRAKDPAQKLLEAWRDKKWLREREATVVEEIRVLELRIQAAKPTEQALRTDRDAVAALVSEEEPFLREADVDLARHQAFKGYALASSALRKQITALEEQRAALVPPTKPELYMEVNGPDAQCLIQTRVKLNQVNSFLSTFDPSSGIGECPECGTAVASLAGKIATYKTDKENLSFVLGNLIAKESESRKYDSDEKDYRRQWGALAERITSLRQQQQAMRSLEAPSRTEAELQKIQAECLENKSGLAALQKEHAELAEKLSFYESRLTAQREVLTQLQARMAGNTSTAEEAEAAEVRLDKQELMQKQAAAATARREALSFAEVMEKEAIAREEEIQKASARARALQSHFEQVRAVVHRSRLPRRVSQANLDYLDREIDDVLTRFDAPFRVKAQEGLRYKATFRDGRQMPAQRLSIGEKTVFAIAFRMAVNARFARDLGLLVLDEPTAGLDDGNLDCLKVALERLRTLSKSRGLQVVLITHEKTLDPLFDLLVELPSRR